MCHMCTPHLTLLKPSPPEQHQQTTTLHCPSPRTQQCSCFYVGGWEGGRVGVNEGGKGGGGRERVCEKRVVPHNLKSEPTPPPLAPVFRRAPVQHSIGRRVFRHMVV